MTELQGWFLLMVLCIYTAHKFEKDEMSISDRIVVMILSLNGMIACGFTLLGFINLLKGF